ncbi:MAG TPA: MFS transporter [Burkholderiales bacterium]|nr:MFS transporter [Burkholderiales bacterium]
MKDIVRPQRSAIPSKPQDISLAFLITALLMGHTMASMALLVLPAVAPVVAREYDIDASLIGYLISLVSAGMLVTLTLLSNITRRLGACRTNQMGHGSVGAGLALMMVPMPAFLAVGAVVLGFGYGLIGPSFSHLLMRFSPPKRRNFIFSLQQTGVPLGGVMAALIAPAVAIAFGWRWAIVLSVLLLGCIIALMQRGRARWDDDRNPKAAALSINPLANFFMVWRSQPLRRLALAGGAFCWAQFCVGAYTVVACVQALEMSLIAAGAMLTLVQVASALGRVFAGWLADTLHDTARVLAWNAALMLATCIASIWMSPGWPLWAVYALFALHGMTSGSWAGAVLAEAGRLAPNGVVSAAVSGVMVYINIGKFIGPIVFANTYLLTQSYGWAFASIGIPALAAWLYLKYKNINKNKFCS